MELSISTSSLASQLQRIETGEAPQEPLSPAGRQRRPRSPRPTTPLIRTALLRRATERRARVPAPAATAAVARHIADFIRDQDLVFNDTDDGVAAELMEADGGSPGSRARSFLAHKRRSLTSTGLNRLLTELRRPASGRRRSINVSQRELTVLGDDGLQALLNISGLEEFDGSLNATVVEPEQVAGGTRRRSSAEAARRLFDELEEFDDDFEPSQETEETSQPSTLSGERSRRSASTPKKQKRDSGDGVPQPQEQAKGPVEDDADVFGADDDSEGQEEYGEETGLRKSDRHEKGSSSARYADNQRDVSAGTSKSVELTRRRDSGRRSVLGGQADAAQEVDASDSARLRGNASGESSRRRDRSYRAAEASTRTAQRLDTTVARADLSEPSHAEEPVSDGRRDIAGDDTETTVTEGAEEQAVDPGSASGASNDADLDTSVPTPEIKRSVRRSRADDSLVADVEASQSRNSRATESSRSALVDRHRSDLLKVIGTPARNRLVASTPRTEPVRRNVRRSGADSAPARAASFTVAASSPRGAAARSSGIRRSRLSLVTDDDDEVRPARVVTGPLGNLDDEPSSSSLSLSDEQTPAPAPAPRSADRSRRSPRPPFISPRPSTPGTPRPRSGTPVETTSTPYRSGSRISEARSPRRSGTITSGRASSLATRVDTPFVPGAESTRLSIRPGRVSGVAPERGSRRSGPAPNESRRGGEAAVPQRGRRPSGEYVVDDRRQDEQGLLPLSPRPALRRNLDGDSRGGVSSSGTRSKQQSRFTAREGDDDEGAGRPSTATPSKRLSRSAVRYSDDDEEGAAELSTATPSNRRFHSTATPSKRQSRSTARYSDDDEEGAARPSTSTPSKRRSHSTATPSKRLSRSAVRYSDDDEEGAAELSTATPSKRRSHSTVMPSKRRSGSTARYSDDDEERAARPSTATPSKRRSRSTATPSKRQSRSTARYSDDNEELVPEPSTSAPSKRRSHSTATPSKRQSRSTARYTDDEEEGAARASTATPSKRRSHSTATPSKRQSRSAMHGDVDDDGVPAGLSTPSKRARSREEPAAAAAPSVPPSRQGLTLQQRFQQMMPNFERDQEEAKAARQKADFKRRSIIQAARANQPPKRRSVFNIPMSVHRRYFQQSLHPLRLAQESMYEVAAGLERFEALVEDQLRDVMRGSDVRHGDVLRLLKRSGVAQTEAQLRRQIAKRLPMEDQVRLIQSTYSGGLVLPDVNPLKD